MPVFCNFELSAKHMVNGNLTYANTFRIILLALILAFSGRSAFSQCVAIQNPATGGFTTQPFKILRCPALNDPIPGTVNIVFQNFVSNFTIDWGNGDIQTYTGPLLVQPYTYNTSQQFNIRIKLPGCADSLKLTYVNERNVNSSGVIVPGTGFIGPPSGISNKRCVPEDLTITNVSPGMNGYSNWLVTWGDGERDTIGSDFNRSYTHRYQKGTAGCSLKINIVYVNGCGVNPVNRPNTALGDYFFKDIDSAMVNPSSVVLCGPTEVVIDDNSTLNCLDSLDREILWARTRGFAAALPNPGDNIFRTYNAINRKLTLPASSFIPIPPDSTYGLRMVLQNTCGADSADVTVRIVSPTQPRLAVVNNNTCPGEVMNFLNQTSNRPFQSYRIDFGDGTVTNGAFQANFSHTYSIGGTYKVKMSTIVNGYNGQTCSLSDSITVTVKTTVTPIVTAFPVLGCDTLTVRIENNSRNTTGVTWLGWQFQQVSGTTISAGSGVLPTLVNFTQAQVLSTNLADSSALVKFKQHGRYIIRLRAQSLGCPQLEGTDTVDIYPSANIRWRVSPRTVCLGNPVSIRDSSSVLSSTVTATQRRGLNTNWNHISWHLDMGDGTTYQSASNITFNFNVVEATNRLTNHVYSSPGTYTVKLTVQSPNRCPKIDSVRITVLPSTIPAFRASRDSCNPGLITLRNQTSGFSQRYIWTIRRGTNLFSTETRLAKDTFQVSLPYFPPGDSTSYFITLTAISGTAPDTCASTTAPFLIKIPPAKQAAFSVSQTDGCTPIRDLQIINQSIGIPSDGSHVYLWNFGNGNTFIGENPPLQNFVNSGTGFKKDTIRLRITSGSICVYNSEKIITIYPDPLPVISAPEEVCHSNPVSFSATGNGLGAYLWDFSAIDGSTSSQPNPTRTLQNTGTNSISYSYSLIAASVAGCVDTVVKTITVNPVPTASFTANPEAACGASPVLFDASSSLAASLYTWNFSDGTSGIQDTTAAVVSRFFPENISSTDKTYNISLSTKTGKGCASSPFSRTVRIRPTVRAAFTLDQDSGCSPLQVNFINLSTQTDNNYTWFVNELGAPGLGIPAASNRPNFGFSTLLTNTGFSNPVRYVVTLQVRDDNGSPVCESSFSDTITVFPKPLSAFVRENISPASLCSPTSQQLIPRGSLGASTYNWNFGDGSPEVVKTDTLPLSYVYSNSTVSLLTFTSRLITGNSFGCTDTSSQAINIRPSVSAEISADDFSSCSPLVSNISNNSSAASVSYTWFRNGAPVFFNKDLPQQTFLNNSSTDSAFYEIFLISRGIDDVCTDTSQVLKFSVPPRPVVQISSNPTNGCSPLAVSLSAAGTTGGSTFTWYRKISTESNFTLIGQKNSTTPFTDTLLNSGLSPINYMVKSVVTGPGGCLDSAQTNVTVFPDVIPAFSQTATQGCSPLPVSFDITSSAPVGTTFVWKINGVPQFDPTPSSFQSSFSAASDTSETQYLIALQAISPGGCVRETLSQVRVFPQPVPDFNQLFSPSTLCSPVAAQFFPVVPSNVATLTWGFGASDSLVSTQDTAVGRIYENNTAVIADTQVTLKVQTLNGCKAEVSKTFKLNPRIIAGFSPSVSSGCGPLQVTFINNGSSPGANSFEWLIDGILAGTNPLALSQTFTNGSPSASRLVKVQLVARNSSAPACTDTATRFVEILPNPLVQAAGFPVTGCSPLKTTFSAAATQGGSQFRWFTKKSNETNFTQDTTLNGPASFSRVLTNTGSATMVYNVKLLVQGLFGCRDSSSFDVTVFPELSSSFTIGPDSAGCAPFSALMGNSTASPAANSFIWLVDDVQVSNSPAFLNFTFQNASPTTSKTYKVQLIGSNAGFGCADTATRFVNALPVPLVDFTTSLNPASGCSPVLASFSPLNVSGADSLLWNLPDSLLTTADTTVSRLFENNGLLPQTRFVSLLARNTAGCQAVKSASFQVNPGVRAGILSFRDSLCSPAEFSFINNSSAGVNVAEWYVDGIFKGSNLSSLTTTLINSDSVPKNFIIRLAVRNSVSSICRDTAEIRVTVLPRPVSGNLIASAENGCAPLSVALNGTTQFADRFFWDFGDGQSKDTSSQSLTHVFNNLNPALIAEYNVLQIASNQFGCRDSSTVKIRVRPNVTAGISASDSAACSPFTVSLSAASSVNANSFTWNFGDGNSGSGINVSRVYSNNSDTLRTFMVRLVADRSSVGCPDTAFLPIRVFPQPAADFDVSQISGCQPLPVQFTSQAQRADSVWWILSSAGIADTLAGLPGASFDTIFSNPASQNMVVKAEHYAITNLGCTANSSKNITISPFVNADFSLSSDSGCSPLAVNLSNLSSPGAVASWFVDGNLVSNAPNQFSFNFVNNTQELKVFRVLLQVSNVLNAACTDTITRLVRVFPKPVAGILGALPDNGCSPVEVSFFSNAQGASRYLYDFNDGTVLDTTIGTASHTYLNNSGLTTRTFTARLTVSNLFGCSDQSSRVLNIKPTVTAIISSPDTLGCSPYSSGFSGVTSVNSNLYSWDFGDGTGSGLATPVKIFENNSDTIQKVRIRLITDRSGVGCPDTAFASIRVLPRPQAEFLPNPLSGCNPLSVSLTNLSSGTQSAFWTFSGNGQTVTRPVTALPFDTVLTNSLSNVSLNVDVSITAINSFGCSATKSRVINIAPYVEAAFVKSADSGCSPLRVQFINQAPVGNLVEWLIDGQPLAGGLSALSYTFENTGLSTRNFEVMQIARSALVPDCRDTLRQIVRVFPRPQSGLLNALPDVACSPANIDLVGSVTGATTFRWSFGDGSDLDTSSQIVQHVFTNNNASNNRSYNVRLIALSDKECADTSFRTVTIRPLVKAGIFVLDTIACTPFQISLSASASVNANQFQWDFGNGQGSTLSNPSITFVNNSDSIECRRVRLIASKNGIECADTSYKTICIKPAPVPVFSLSPESGCQPLAVSVQNQSADADSTVWQFISGGFLTEAYGSSYDTLVENPGFQVKTVRVILNTFNSQGCVGKLEKQFKVSPLINADFAASVDSGCSPLPVSFFNQSTAGSVPFWYIDGIPVPGTGFGLNRVFVNNEPVTREFEVKLIARSGQDSACTDTVRKKIRVFPRPAVSFSVLPSVLQLPQTTVAISNLTQFRPSWTYEWDFGDGSSSSSGDAVINHDYAALMSDLSSLVITVKLKASSSQGCSSDTSVQITVLPVPPVVEFEPDTQGCQPLPVVFRNNSRYGNFYEWTFGDGTTSNEQNPVHLYQNPGIYSVTLKVTGPGGSTSMRRDNIIQVYRTPSAEFSPDEPVVITIPNDPYLVRGSVPPAGENWTYEWDFGDGGSGNGQSVRYFYNEIGEYNVTLTVTSDKGCVNSKTLPSGVRTKLGGAIQVPNAFIPSNIPADDFMVGDKNRRTDIFYPFSEGVKEIQMEIFNRWGVLVYFSNQVNKGWNGWSEGKQCKSDVYVYKIKATFSDGRQETRVGDVTLIR